MRLGIDVLHAWCKKMCCQF